MIVLEELDQFKKAEERSVPMPAGWIRCLEQLRLRGDLISGVPLENGGSVRVEKNYVNVTLPEDLSDVSADNRILRVCLGLDKAHEEQVVLVTKDLLLRDHRRRSSASVHRILPRTRCWSARNQYTGRCELYVPEELF